ncbi:MAG TPA: penicillin-binding protein [Spirochaetales bacterium]|nr:penicillin-binding protein [Spirochaetales bacterium]
MEKNLKRFYILIGLIVISMLFVLYRFLELSLMPPPEQKLYSQTAAIRGAIFDRNGRLLAGDIDTYDLAVWKPSIKQSTLQTVLEQLAVILQVDSKELSARIHEKDSNYVYIARSLDHDVAEAVRAYLSEGKIQGFSLERKSRRVYPEGSLASHLLGFVSLSNEGIAGIEASLDKELTPGKQNAHAGFAFGNSVYLTIDSTLQYKLEKLCKAVLLENNAEGVMMVVMEAKTGRIVSYISMPDYDPNTPFDAPRENWLDRVANYVYEPGSVMKVFTMGVILSLGGITDQTTFYCRGAYEKEYTSGEKVIIRCSTGAHGAVNLEKILAFSCNTGAALASETVSVRDFYAKLRAFGFGEKTGVEIKLEDAGLIQPPERWSGRTKPTIAIGQEILVTALQLTTAATAVANGGLLMRAHVLDKIMTVDNQLVFQAEPTPIKQVLTPAQAKAILKAMEAATLDFGTGKRARIEDMPIAVKTGTAQMLDPKTKRYSETDFIASTLAIFPSSSPQYILYAAVIKPRGSSIFGARVVAPVVKDAILTIASQYGLERASVATVEHPDTIVLPPAVTVQILDTMPDLRGVAKKLLLPLLKRTDIHVIIEGNGWVVRQEPNPGTPVKPGMTIRLWLE